MLKSAAMKKNYPLVLLSCACLGLALPIKAFSPDSLFLGEIGLTDSVTAINRAGTMVTVNYVLTAGTQYSWRALVCDGTTAADLGSLGGTDSFAYGVNDSGVVVGQSQLSQGTYRAFAAVGGRMIDLGTLGGDYSAAFDINDAGTIVGQSLTGGGLYHAFSFSNGKMTDLGTISHPSYRNDGRTAAYAVNRAGTVVGTSNGWAFSYSNGVMTALDGTALDPLDTAAYAINDSGTIVGACENSLTTHAMSYSNGVMTDLGDLGQGAYAGLCFSVATAISNDGTIVGYGSLTPDFPFYPFVDAFVYKDGVMIDLGPDFDPDSTSYACAVDSHGNVFGSALEDGLQQYLLYQAK